MRRAMAIVLFGLMVFSFLGVQNYFVFLNKGKIELSGELDLETELDLDAEFTKFVTMINSSSDHTPFTVKHTFPMIQDLMLPISYEVEIRPPRA